MASLATQVAQTTVNLDSTTTNLDRLSEEMRQFREETREETRAFKDEMREGRRAFQDKMQASSDAADRRWGELANKMGTLAEDLVAPGIPGVFRDVFHVEDPEWRVRVHARSRKDRSRRKEFDVVAWGGEVFLVNETKSQARPEDIEPLLRTLAETRDFFAEAETLRIVGSLASFYVDPSLVRAAEREGLLVFGLDTGLLRVLNAPEFKPRMF